MTDAEQGPGAASRLPGPPDPHLTLVPLAGDIIVLDVDTMRPLEGRSFETPEFAADYAAAYIAMRRING